jgi:hypothetical protein
MDPRFLLTPPEPSEGLAGNPSIGIGRSADFTGRSLDSTQEESEGFFPESYYESKDNKYKKLMEKFISISDALDKEGQIELANFSDFLISKIAQQLDSDPEKLLKELILKIGSSDILNNNIILINVVKIYNDNLMSNIINNLDKNESKSRAYQVALEEAKKYVI